MLQPNCPSTFAHSHIEESISRSWICLLHSAPSLFHIKEILSFTIPVHPCSKTKDEESELRMVQNINEDGKTVLSFCACFTVYAFCCPSPFPLSPQRESSCTAGSQNPGSGHMQRANSEHLAVPAESSIQVVNRHLAPHPRSPEHFQ